MNTVYYAARFLVKDILWSLLFFLPWWYLTGRRNIEHALLRQLKDVLRSLHIRTLGRFLFTSMYGLTDPVSRVISVIVRLVHFSILLTLTSIYAIALIVIYILWLVFPLFVAYNIAFHSGVLDLNLYTITQV